MRITRIDVEGQDPAHTARLSRLPEGLIEAELHSPELDDLHRAAADDQAAQSSMAEWLQETLDGARGTNSMIHDYLDLIARLAD